MAEETSWGTPDWRSEDGYDDCESWNINRWQWEFIRRRSDVREWFDKHLEAQRSRNEEFDDWKREKYPEDEEVRHYEPHEAGFVVAAGQLGLGISSVPNPRIGDQPYQAISFANPTPAIRNPIHGTDVRPEDKDKFGQSKVTVPPKHIALQFDLEKPIAPQLESAKSYLLEFQVREIGKKVQFRTHREKWPTYLRVLDARSANATWKEVASILPKSFGQKSEQTARNVHDQAQELCFNFRY